MFSYSKNSLLSLPVVGIEPPDDFIQYLLTKRFFHHAMCPYRTIQSEFRGLVNLMSSLLHGIHLSTIISDFFSFFFFFIWRLQVQFQQLVRITRNNYYNYNNLFLFSWQLLKGVAVNKDLYQRTKTVFCCSLLFLIVKLRRGSDWNLRRSDVLINPLEPWWCKRLCGIVVLQTSIWEPYHYIGSDKSEQSDAEALGNAEYPFIAIAPKFHSDPEW